MVLLAKMIQVNKVLQFRASSAPPLSDAGLRRKYKFSVISVMLISEAGPFGSDN